MVKSTTLGNLLAFMHIYNLRFGPAQTPHQKLIYEQIYPALDEVRDRISKESKADEIAQANPDHVSDVLNNLKLNDKKDAPAPPNPNQ
jgi:hypothetical protein